MSDSVTREPRPALERRYLALIERNAGRIRRLCRGWAGGVDPEDLEAEVNLQLWRSLPSFEGRAKEDTWVYRVALNTVMMARRYSRSRGWSVGLLGDAPHEPATAPESHARLERRERSGALAGALARLGETDRWLMTLWLEELSYAQIAEVLGIDENLVGVRIHRAKKKLRSAMEALSARSPQSGGRGR